MPRAILTFKLPQEQAEFHAAVNGSRAKAVLWDIDQHCRSWIKHGNPSEQTARLAEEIRQMIAEEPGVVD